MKTVMNKKAKTVVVVTNTLSLAMFNRMSEIANAKGFTLIVKIVA
jgi:hypothetical protein